MQISCRRSRNKDHSSYCRWHVSKKYSYCPVGSHSNLKTETFTEHISRSPKQASMCNTKWRLSPWRVSKISLISDSYQIFPSTQRVTGLQILEFYGRASAIQTLVTIHLIQLPDPEYSVRCLFLFMFVDIFVHFWDWKLANCCMEGNCWPQTFTENLLWTATVTWSFWHRCFGYFFHLKNQSQNQTISKV